MARWFGTRTLIALMVSVVMIGCGERAKGEGNSAEEPAIELEKPAFYLSSSIWNSTSIPVCWDKIQNTYTQESDWARNAVATAWEANSKLRFTGWGLCTADSKTGIRISIADESSHTTALGKYIDGKEGGMVLNFIFNAHNKTCRNSAGSVGHSTPM